MSSKDKKSKSKRDVMVLNRQNLKLVLVPSEAPYAFKSIKNALICPPSPVGVLKLPLDL